MDSGQFRSLHAHTAKNDYVDSNVSHHQLDQTFLHGICHFLYTCTDIVSVSSFIGTKDSEKTQVGRGRLTERLLAQGLLTPNMLQELRREWTQVH